MQNASSESKEAVVARMFASTPREKGEPAVAIDLVPTDVARDLLPSGMVEDASRQWNHHTAGRFTPQAEPPKPEVVVTGVPPEVALALMLLMLAAGATGGYLYGSSCLPPVG